MALNAALATAGRALEVFSTAVQVSANNLSNANTPGYVRDELELEPSRGTPRGNLIVGNGVQTVSIKQSIDRFLEQRIHSANADAEASSAKERIFAQLELELRELGDADLSSRLNSFLGAIHEVVNLPEQTSLRANVLEEGKLVAAEIRDLRSRLNDLRRSQTNQIDGLVSESNDLIHEVQNLNRQIAQQEINGVRKSEAGSLRTQRLQALNRLSQIVPVTFIEQPSGTVDVFSGGDYILHAGQIQQLTTDPTIDRGVTVQNVSFEKTNSSVALSGGELKGIIEGRDEIIGGFIDQLDTLANGLISAFNQVHSSGEGIEGFTSLVAAAEVTDPAATLNDAGLPFDIRHGQFTLKVINQQTGITHSETIRIDLDGIGGNDTTLEDLRTAIDATTNLSSSITADGAISIDVDTGFEFRFADDSSGALAALGINTFFTGSDSASIGVNATITGNRNLFAAGKGDGPGDNSNAIELAQILDQPVASLGGVSVIGFYESTVAGVAQGSASQQANSRGLESFRESLLTQREQFSGVSLDEEAIRLIEFQQAFAASARVIQTVDELFQVLVGL